MGQAPVTQAGINIEDGRVHTNGVDDSAENAFTFTISIIKEAGTHIGLDAYDHYTIAGIRSGLVEEWNIDHPELEVKVGDRIVEVNGIRDDIPNMRSECQKHKSLQIKLLRDCEEAQLPDSAVPEHAGRIGLTNLGNTCFMNAGLQCLAHIEPLAAYFLEDCFQSELNRENPLGCGGELAENFAELQKALWLGEDEVVRPRQLHKKLTSFAPHLFEGGEQQDIQEFLAFCLDGLHEDLNRVRKQPPPMTEADEKDDARQASQKGDEFAAALAWRRHLERGKSFLVDLLQGQLRSSLTCTSCGHTSRRFEPFLYLSVPVTERMQTVTEAVLKFTEEEVLADGEQWFCDGCRAKVRARKCIDIWKLPEVLVLHMKRFEFDATTGRFHKIKTLLHAPQQLDLSKCLSPPALAGQRQAAIYDVVAVANHLGQFEGGHYTATCRVGGQWFHFDDERVRPLGPDTEVVNHEAYVIFLVRCANRRQGVARVARQTIRRPDNWPHRIRPSQFDFFARTSSPSNPTSVGPKRVMQALGLGNRNGLHGEQSTNNEADVVRESSKESCYLLQLPSHRAGWWRKGKARSFGQDTNSQCCSLKRLISCIC